VDRNRLLLERLDKGELDLVLALGNSTRDDAEPVATLPLVWIGPTSAEPIWGSGEPIPLVMYEPPCFFRQGALAALDHAGLPWRIAFTSPSLHGLWAAVEAGLGVTLRTAVGLPAGVLMLGDTVGLPPAPETALALCLHDGGRPLVPALARLRSVIIEALTENLPRTTTGATASPQ
jgi:DNA-binding transcriptional LysR family regulator